MSRCNAAVLLAGVAALAFVMWHSGLALPRVDSAEEALVAALQVGAGAGIALPQASAAAVSGTAADAMRRVGWRSDMQFASFAGDATLEAALAGLLGAAPSCFLLIVPGDAAPRRRDAATPFLSVDPAAAGGGLAATLGPAAAALNTAVTAAEAALGRRLFEFRLETAAMPVCSSGTGPCAVWEVSSGRVVLDAGLAARIAGAGASEEGGGHAVPRAAAEEESSLRALLATFVDKLAEQAAPATALLQSGHASLPNLAAVFAQAGAVAVPLAMAAQLPFWWCILCPLVLGMLAPFVLNMGLTAAAEALCAQLHLPDQQCTDLWWGAFALALMLSLSSAIPIVYLCRLPECGRHAAAAGLAAARSLVR